MFLLLLLSTLHFQMFSVLKDLKLLAYMLFVIIAVAGVLPLLTPALLLVRDAPSISVVAGVLSVA
jgi:hypothetical protein